MCLLCASVQCLMHVARARGGEGLRGALARSLIRIRFCGRNVNVRRVRERGGLNYIFWVEGWANSGRMRYTDTSDTPQKGFPLIRLPVLSRGWTSTNTNTQMLWMPVSAMGRLYLRNLHVQDAFEGQSAQLTDFIGATSMSKMPMIRWKLVWISTVSRLVSNKVTTARSASFRAVSLTSYDICGLLT